MSRLGHLDYVRRDHMLAASTTYKLGGPADFYVEAESEAQLQEAIEAARLDEIGVMIVGRGSNLVVADTGWRGLAVRLGPAFSFVDLSEADVAHAGGATPLPGLARESTQAGRGGLEFFVGIPGSVGGAVRMNAGGHGSDTARVLIAARVLDSETTEYSNRTPADMEMSYRHTNLGRNDVVVSARFRTHAIDPEEGREIIREITRWRRQHQPGGTLNAGSVFKNPAEAPAGKVIDELGLKGYAVGGVSISHKHANFFEAGPEATAADVYRLVQQVRELVEQETGIRLETEIQFVGDFE
jgi:UDP-N-acetylmuramate dehydrogenase